MSADGSKPLADVVTVSAPEEGCRDINLDNAATTPPLLAVEKAVHAVMHSYGSVHRGSGSLSRISTYILERARQRIFEFAGGHNRDDTIIFGHNSTTCMNILARRMAQTYGEGFCAVSSVAEHTSNLLPWLRWASVVRCRLTQDGDWDLDHLDHLLAQPNRPRVVAITSASNVTGRLTNVDDVARLAHEYGIPIAVDASQFVAHRCLSKARSGSSDLWDFVVFAGHKMYAPYGVGVLVGPAKWFSSGWPDHPGGGTISMINGDQIAWSPLPYREEGGTPNYPGIVAIASAAEEIENIGFERIEAHEASLLSTAAEVFGALKEVMLFRPLDRQSTKWLPVFPFSVHGYEHQYVGNYLGHTKNIAVRTGHVCQHEFVRKLLGVSDLKRNELFEAAKHGNLNGMYGVIRASCGLTNTIADIKSLGMALEELLLERKTSKVDFVEKPVVNIPHETLSKLPWLV